MKLPAGFPVQKDVPPPVSLCIRVPPEHVAEAARMVAGVTDQPVEVPWIPTLNVLQEYLVGVHGLEAETQPHMTVQMYSDGKLDNAVDTVAINDAGIVQCSSSANPEQKARILGLMAYVWDGPSANIVHRESIDIDQRANRVPRR